MDQKNGSRTVICSVVFVDIVEFSQQPVSLQMEAKNILNRLITGAIKDLDSEDHIVLDTGDGAALCFIGAPEEALFAANALLGALLRLRSPREMALRIGINLGSVKLVKDIHGQRNIIGDGINLAQRVMSFAQPNQILVSRSYHDVVSNLSPEYAKLFRYIGVRQDKHVREHVVYEVNLSPAQRSQASSTGDETIVWPVRGYVPKHPPQAEMEEASIAQPTTAAVDSLLDEQWLAELEQELAKDVGPIAKVLVRKFAQKDIPPSDIIAAIEQELGYEPGSSAFSQRIRMPARVMEKPPPAIQIEVDSKEDKSVSSSAWTEQQLRVLEKELTRYLGPVVPILIRKMAKKHTRYAQLCEALVAQIDDQTVRQRILANLLKAEKDSAER